jgi:hypothetical protein
LDSAEAFGSEPKDIKAGLLPLLIKSIIGLIPLFSFERVGIVEVQGKLAVDSNRSKVAHGSVIFETEDLREETGRSFLITRRHNRMIQRYCHTSSPGKLGL